MSTFQENLKKLPGISHLAGINLLDEAGNIVATLENKPGQAGSVAVYNYLAQIHGAITPQAAAKGIELYAEHGEDAKLNPGKHPNIDRLSQLLEQQQTLRIKHLFAV